MKIIEKVFDVQTFGFGLLTAYVYMVLERLSGEKLHTKYLDAKPAVILSRLGLTLLTGLVLVLYRRIQNRNTNTTVETENHSTEMSNVSIQTPEACQDDSLHTVKIEIEPRKMSRIARTLFESKPAADSPITTEMSRYHLRSKPCSQV